MIDLFYHTTPNARKVLMMLEEVRAQYRIAWTDITRGEQLAESYRRINPNAKVPAIVDHHGPEGAPFAVFESGAILVYLAEKFGKLLPTNECDRYRALTWIFWQVSGQGPMCGQGAHFFSHAPGAGIDIPYAKDRYLREATHYYEVLERQLTDREYLVGEFSIADIAAFPWTRVAKGHGIQLSDYPNVKRWSDAIAARPSAQVRPEDDKGIARGQGYRGYSREQWEVLFGASQPTTPVCNAANDSKRTG